MLSFAENIPIILSVVDKIKPKSVLDVGVGFGKYGLLLKEQYISRKAGSGDLMPDNDFVIDAIEDTEYFTKGNNGCTITDIYREVYEYSVNDMCLFLEDNYDLCMLIDTIEHWTKEYTKNILTKLSGYCQNILISTPKNCVMYTKHYYGDPRSHITQYGKKDLITMNPWNIIHDTESKDSHIVMYQKLDNNKNIV